MRKSIWKKLVAAATAMAMVITLAPPANNAQAAGKGKIKSVTVKVKKKNVKNQTLTLKKGSSLTVTVTVKATGKLSKAVNIKSADTSKVKVSGAKLKKATTTAKLTAKKKGTVKITVTSKGDKKKKVTFKIKVTDKKTDVTPTANPTAKPSAKPTGRPTATPEPKSADKAGYTQVWADEFNGAKLNRDDWNVEIHDPGWVNSEQQAYVDTEANIYIKDGSLVLKPIKTTENGKTSYTSGRVNTQGKHDYKYGMFEARVKVPEGQGYLPAFWMMPTDENLYGQWPKCGEIDGMEVMGQETNKCYGTIHYGSPHEENQGTKTLETGAKDFSEEYHVFDVEWEPGKITWYVDGEKYHEANNWYSAVEGKGTKTYPAPFDQPFYVILNLAVGGSWVGMTDDTTDFEKAEYAIDYVRVYQKDSYDENVTKPAAEEVTLREPDANGNYIVNGNFAEAESLEDETGWVFKHAQGGEATPEIKDNAITIKTTKEGEVDYSVQLVQADLPVKKNASYTLSFDAKASADRSMVVSVNSPDRGYKRYLSDQTVQMTTEKKTFTYDFTMRDDSDANARLDFNMGKAGSTADIEISNVVLKKTVDDVGEEAKSVRADGNYIYNGEFDEGDVRLGFWEISDADKANVSVTNENNIRKLKVVAPEGTTADKPVVVAQSDLGLTAKGKYELSYKASKESAGADDKSLVVSFAGKDYETALTKDEKSYVQKIELTEALKQENADFALKFTAPGTYYVDDVKIVEDALIKNGSFNAGLSGFTPYIYEAAKADYTVDSLKEDNAFSITINDTGDADWHVQLYQDGVNVEKGKFYRLSFKAKSTLDRTITCAVQRNGSADDDWTPYFDTMKAKLTKDYQTFTVDFEMKNASDPAARCGFAMGKIDEKITTQHSICIDDISLVEISESEANVPKVEVPAADTNGNLLKNADFANGTENWNAYATSADSANITLKDGKATFPLTSVGENAWDVAMEQTGLVLETGAKYKLTFKASSTADRTISVGFFTTGDKYQGGDNPVLTSTEKEYTIEFTPEALPESPASATLKFSLGVFTDYSSGSAVKVDTPASTITISDLKFEKVG